MKRLFLFAVAAALISATAPAVAASATPVTCCSAGTHGSSGAAPAKASPFWLT